MLTLPGASSPLNASVALTATVTPSAVTGKITFYDGATLIGTVPATQGVAVLNWAPFLAGQRSLRAFYQGSDTYASSYSTAVNLTVQAVSSGDYSLRGGFGNYPATGPVIADFNKDGVPDLAALESNGNVLLLLGTESGFSGSEPITGFSSPSGMAAADFDGDGYVDLAIADTGNTQVVIYYGNGDGTFRAGSTYSTTNACYAIVAADFNGDGIVDLVTSDGTNGLSLFINNGDGTFGAAVNSAITGNIAGFAAGDFNGDGIADLALANPTANAVDILFGAYGGFSSPVAYTVGLASAITVADFNGDHIMDVMAVNNLAQTASLLLGNGDGTFQIQVSAGSLFGASNIIVSGDLDGDNYMDVLALGPSSITLLMGHGDGTFYAPWGGAGGDDAVSGAAIGAVDTSGRTGAMITTVDAGVEIASGAPYPPSISGGNQQMLVGGASAPVPLQVQLMDYGHPVQAAGVPVLFSAPQQGAGGYFTGSGFSATVNTAADGSATAPVFVSNSAIGSYSVQVSANSDELSFSLSNAAPTVGPTTCSYSVSPAALVYNSSGGSNTVSVAPSLPGCVWSASSDSSWLAPAATNFTGAGTVAITAPANVSGNSQTGNVLVAGQYISVLQWATAPVVTDAPPGSFGVQVTDMVGYGFSSGCSAAPLDYCPDNPVTRAQAAILLVRGVYGSDNFAYSTTPHFNDVDASTFGFQWIQKLYELGITTGCGNGDYCPSEDLPRDQAAVLVVRSRLGAQTPFDNPSVPYFTDVPSSAFGFAAIQRLRLENITSGCTATTFCPADPITRGDLAVFIIRGLTNQFLPVGTALISEVTTPGQSVRTLATYSTTTLTLSGQNTHFDQATSTVVVAGAVTTANLTVYSPTYATVDVTGGENTPLDIPESIIVTTGSEEAVIPNPIVFEWNCD